MAPPSDASKLGEITLLLHKVGAGDANAADRILPLVYVKRDWVYARAWLFNEIKQLRK